MNTLVAIPVMGSYEIGRISLYQFDHMASPDCRFLLIDNSGADSQYPALFERGFLNAKRWDYVRNATNIGLVRSCQQAYDYAVEIGASLLVLTHNDVWVYPEDACFDQHLEAEFAHESKLGIIGLFGSKGCGREGHRLDTFGSLVEMAGHGRKIERWIEPAVCLDGFFLACRVEMLRLAGGFDQRYQWHHVYDYDISLTSIELGYRNAVLNLPCHHLSGLTANNAAYSTSGPDVHTANYERWKTKWQPRLGLTVDNDWHYTWKVGQ